MDPAADLDRRIRSALRLHRQMRLGETETTEVIKSFLAIAVIEAYARTTAMQDDVGEMVNMAYIRDILEGKP